MNRAILMFGAAAVMAGIAAGWYVTTLSQGDRFAACRASTVAGGVAEIGGPFTLIDAEGRTRTDADVITGPTLVYFGFTFCPDYCPMDLARNAAAADILAEQGETVGQVFISVDPERDTPEVMGEFTRWIHPDLIGLTGTEAQTAAAANAYRVFWRRAAGDDDFYLIDHSTFTYLMDPEHGFLDVFPTSATPEDVAAGAACYLARL